jgi:hypothetical protein
LPSSWMTSPRGLMKKWRPPAGPTRSCTTSNTSRWSRKNWISHWELTRISRCMWTPAKMTMKEKWNRLAIQASSISEAKHPNKNLIIRILTAITVHPQLVVIYTTGVSLSPFSGERAAVSTTLSSHLSRAFALTSASWHLNLSTRMSS